jgi:hypothetical protein
MCASLLGSLVVVLVGYPIGNIGWGPMQDDSIYETYGLAGSKMNINAPSTKIGSTDNVKFQNPNIK